MDDDDDDDVGATKDDDKYKINLRETNINALIHNILTRRNCLFFTTIMEIDPYLKDPANMQAAKNPGSPFR